MGLFEGILDSYDFLVDVYGMIQDSLATSSGLGGVFRQVTGFKAIANPGHVNNLLHLRSRDDPWREWWFNPR